jgi:Rap1a immunity proteins
MRAILCGAVLALTFTTAEAAQKDYSANGMLVYCKGFIGQGQFANNEVASAYCNGMVETLVFMSPFLSDNPVMCIQLPKGSTSQQAARVIVRYIEMRPQRVHEAFHSLALEALHDAWPCSDFDNRFRGNRDSDR